MQQRQQQEQQLIGSKTFDEQAEPVEAEPDTSDDKSKTEAN